MLEQFLAIDAVNLDDYEVAVKTWVSGLTLLERLDAQDQLAAMFEAECNGLPYEGDHDLELIFNTL